MKRALTDFFLPCRKWLIVALLAANLGGCASRDTFNDCHSCPPAAIPFVLLSLPFFNAYEATIGAAKEKRYQRDKKQAKESLILLAQQARDYLQTVCSTDERIFIKPGIVLNDGILALGNDRGNAPLPLLETAPKKIPENGVIRHRRDKYDESRKESIRAFREIQYGYALPWDAGNLSDDPSNARYALSIEDISTLEDRAHWVGRGRLRLIERESGEIVAEYVGFQANPCPGMQKKSPSQRWNLRDYCESGTAKVCPNMESGRRVVTEFLWKIQGKE
ncbi:MAG: hypothetical protein LBQ75_08655 [Zoogloeaceae bacterium]|jgi:hypothetical protein|nr:hypothetical protein [Zoogloeaceae bacterium]